MTLVNTELVEENSRYNSKQIFIVSYNGENNMLMETETVAEAADWARAFKEHMDFANHKTVENVIRESRRMPADFNVENSGSFDNGNASNRASTLLPPM